VKFVKVPRTEATAIVSGMLNELGKYEGELVNVVEVGTVLMAVFKRPVGYRKQPPWVAASALGPVAERCSVHLCVDR
jgi:hypothetical protein